MTQQNLLDQMVQRYGTRERRVLFYINQEHLELHQVLLGQHPLTTRQQTQTFCPAKNLRDDLFHLERTRLELSRFKVGAEYLDQTNVSSEYFLGY